MIVFVDRRGRVVSTFVHFSDSVLYEQDNLRHGYRRFDFPNLSDLIEHLVSETNLDVRVDRPGGRIAGE